MAVLQSFLGVENFCKVRDQASHIIEPTLEEREANAAIFGAVFHS